MVDTQVRPSDVTKFPIIDAMLSVPREHYVPQPLREAAVCSGAGVAAGHHVFICTRCGAELVPDHVGQHVDRV